MNSHEILFDVVHEDAELLVVNKPAGLVCHPTKSDERSSLIGRLRLYLGARARPQLVNRLDRETSGIVVVAKTDGAARELRRLWENRAVRKEYLAIVHGWPASDEGTVNAPLGKDESSAVVIRDCVRQDGAAAVTGFLVLQRLSRGADPFSLLRVIPQTGRKHQIRIHLAHIGHPIVGDKIYGPDEQLYLAFVEGRLTDFDRARLLLPFQALHAASLHFEWREHRWEFNAEPENWFSHFIVPQEQPAIVDSLGNLLKTPRK